jgi:integrase
MQAPTSAPRVVTLRRVWTEYQLTRGLKPATLRNYNQRLNTYLLDWLDIPVDQITKNMVEERHRSIAGKAMANSVFRTLRALLHYASFKYEATDGTPLIKQNPVRRLSEVRAWHRDKRRKTVISTAQIKPWMQAVFSLDNSTMRDFFLTLLFSGMRKHEAMSLQWEHIDFNAGTIFIGDSKNGEDFLLPMSSYLRNLLAIRKHGARSRWVFPGKLKDTHISAGYVPVALVIERSGVQFCPHDLRRTFITIGDELNLKSQVVKALVNHKSDDVTEGYTIRSIERLRRSTEKITQAILYHAGLRNCLPPPELFR